MITNELSAMSYNSCRDRWKCKRLFLLIAVLVCLSTLGCNGNTPLLVSLDAEVRTHQKTHALKTIDDLLTDPNFTGQRDQLILLRKYCDAERWNVALPIAKRIRGIAVFELHLIANHDDHSMFIEPSKGNSTVEVNSVRAEWLPIQNGSVASKQLASDTMQFVRATSPGNDDTLVVYGVHDLTNKDVADAESVQTVDGRSVVYLYMTPNGVEKLTLLTSSNLPNPNNGSRRRLGICIGGQVVSAPAIENPVSTQIVIDAKFSQSEAAQLVSMLNAWRE